MGQRVAKDGPAGEREESHAQDGRLARLRRRRRRPGVREKDPYAFSSHPLREAKSCSLRQSLLIKRETGTPHVFYRADFKPISIRFPRTLRQRPQLSLLNGKAISRI